MKLNLEHTFIDELPADKNLENTRRQVTEAVFSYVNPQETANPKLLHVSVEMMEEIGLSKEEVASNKFLDVVTGNAILTDTKPFAMCYAGHQFGNWAGQLGDGRAINIAEVVHENKRWFLQLKGAGETPYSRTADGLAVLRSSIREYLCSEAMFHLGVPTTRALSLSLSGDEVLRDVMYNGNPAYEKGAIVCRAAESFLRFGNFEIFSARNDVKNLKILADYSIKYHFPEITISSEEKYIQFFKAVTKSTLDMIVHWQRVGFVHGVMNTDNMSILGLTIDFGPYGWLEDFDFGWTPNTTDRQNKRYRYGNQPNIGLWNLYQLANSLYPLINDVKPLEEILEWYKINFGIESLKMMKSKLGLVAHDEKDIKLMATLEDNLQLTETDMTIFFRNLSSFSSDKKNEFSLIGDAFYVDKVPSEIKEKWMNWFDSYQQRLKKEKLSDSERAEKMDLVNPKYVLRNYMAQLAIEDAEKGNYALIDELYQLLKKPYSEQIEHQKWFAKRPDWAKDKIGSSMLSCSS